MRYHRVSVSRVIAAPAATTYGLIADYREGHPRILPPAYFRALQVERGGVGQGSVIRYQMRVLGVWRTYRARVEEPAPGSALVETDLGTGAVTTFTVVSGAHPGESVVTITTELMLRDGVAGAIERLMTTALLRRVYAQELARLARVALAPNEDTVARATQPVAAA